MDLISRKYRKSKSRVKRAIRLAKQAAVAAKLKRNEPAIDNSSSSAHFDNGKEKATSTKKLEYFRNNEEKPVSEVQDEFYMVHSSTIQELIKNWTCSVCHSKMIILDSDVQVK